MRLFVTGATGYLGTSIVAALGARGDEVRALIRPNTVPVATLAPCVEPVEATLFDATRLVEVMRGCDAVIHVAGVTSSSGVSAATMHTVNVEGTRNVAHAARLANVGAMVHVSSVAAIARGSLAKETLDETARFDAYAVPLPYHVSKYEAELALQSEYAAGLNGVIVNPAWVFGPGDVRGKRRKLLRAAGRVPLPPGGATVCDVRDVAAGTLAALDWALANGRNEPAARRFILGGETLTYTQIARALAAAQGRSGAVLSELVTRVTVPLAPVVATTLAMGALRALTGVRMPVSGDFRYHAGRYNWFSSGRAAHALHYTPRRFQETARDLVEEYRAKGWLTP